MSHKFKICMIGATGVGKSSLVARFVHSIFDDVYRTTIGVKIETLHLEHRDGIDLVIWDLSGEDEFQSVQPAYLIGAAGYLLVTDGTRPSTITTAMTLRQKVLDTVGDIPLALLVNKSDLAATWDIEPAELAELERTCNAAAIRTSAKTGAGVQQAFEFLIEAIRTSMEAPWT